MSDLRRHLALPSGTVVGQFRLGAVRAAWGFYLAYAAEDSATGQKVVALELLPEELAERTAEGTLVGRTPDDAIKLAWARDQFLRESRALKECPHLALEKVLEVIEAHGTAWRITPENGGRSFKRWLEELGRPPTELELRALLATLLSALGRLHAAGLRHLHLRPEAIVIAPDGKPIVTRFAAALQAIAQQAHASHVIAPGYSPPEQYAEDGREGTWTDIYGLAAVLHLAMTGEAPVDADVRAQGKGSTPLAVRLAGKYDAGFLEAIDRALEVDSSARPQTISAWRDLLGIKDSSAADGHTRTARIAALAAALIFVIGVAAWFWRPIPRPVVADDTITEEKKEEKAAEKPEDKKKMADEKTPETEQTAEQKAVEELAAADLAAKKLAAEKAAAEKAAAEKAAAEKMAAEQAARKAAEEKAAMQKAIREKAEAERVAMEKKAREEKQKKVPPTPPPPSSPTPPTQVILYTSIPVAGTWVPADAADGSPIRLEFSDAKFTLRGPSPLQGRFGMYNGDVRVYGLNDDSLQMGTYKLRGLGRLAITGSPLAGDWRRLKPGPATPAP